MGRTPLEGKDPEKDKGLVDNPHIGSPLMKNYRFPLSSSYMIIYCSICVGFSSTTGTDSTLTMEETKGSMGFILA